MNRIEEKFLQITRDGRKAFIPFVTAGDPDPAASVSIVRKLVELGADIIELGVPFSDPIADGPTIQRSSQRALARGIKLIDVLTIAAEVRRSSDVPIVLFSYFNPILQFGVGEFCTAARTAGIDGVLLTDVIDAEAVSLSRKFAVFGIDLISLAAPTTTDERLRSICLDAKGFIYAVSRAGITGTSESPSSAAEELVHRIRNHTSLPVVVGFGISNREQVEDVWRYADGAVVGSALVAEIEKQGDKLSAVERFVRGLLPKFAKSPVEN